MNRILALDYGDRKIGVAISDPMQIIAKPFKTLNNTTNKNILLDLNEIISEYDINKIIVGLPITLKNKYSMSTSVFTGRFILDMTKSPIPITINKIQELNYSIHTIMMFKGKDKHHYCMD